MEDPVFTPDEPLVPEEGPAAEHVPEQASPGGTEDRSATLVKRARRVFSTLGLGAFVILILGSLLQIGLSALLSAAAPDLLEKPLMLWVVTFVPLYCIAVPMGMALMCRAHAHPAPAERFGAGGVLALFPICIFLAYAGNFLGILATTGLSALRGSEIANPLQTYAMGDGPFLVKLLVMAILAPLIEELIFRRVMIDRMRIYGEKLAVVTSALIFGLFHGNLSQFFYAFFLGLVFGYVYVRTGRLAYSAALHIFINFLGSIIAPWLLSRADLDSLSDFDPTSLLYAGALERFLTPGRVAFFAYIFALILLFLLGLVLLCILGSRLTFYEAERELPRGKRFTTVWCNVGMALLLVASLGVMLLSVLL